MPLRRDAKVELLRRCRCCGLLEDQLRQLARIADEIDCARQLLTRGTLGREFFVLITGDARVSKGKKIADSVRRLVREIALLTDSPRTATVTATSPVDVLVITDRRFREVVETMPSIALKVLACVGDRLASDARS